MESYAIHKLRLQRVPNHCYELFIDFHPNIHIKDIRTPETTRGEIYPIFDGESLGIHYLSPPRFHNTAERNRYKLRMLKEAKAAGNNFYIKGTFHVMDTIDEVLDFFNDRHIVITKRRDIEQHALSYIYATNSELYNAFRTAKYNNIDRYMDAINKGIIAKNINISDMLYRTNQVNNLEQLLQQRNIGYTIAYYEDMNNYDNLFNIITEIYNTTEWMNFLPKDFENYLPTKVDKDYSKCILNYNDIIEDVRRQIKEYQ